MIYSELPIIKVKSEDIPFALMATHYPANFIKCGEVKKGGNEPYCFTQEKLCAGHYCRVLCPDNTMDDALVKRDDNTLWKINFNNFKSVFKVIIDRD